jgi:NitT/TauT family transport system permease protein
MKTIKARLKSIIKTLYAMVAVVLFWYVMHIVMNTSAIPSPYSTIENFLTVFWNTLLPHLFVSFLRILWAILISLILGGFIGLWSGISKRADQFIAPIVYILYPLPKIAFLPILMIIFGLGETPKVALIVIIIVFQFIMAVRDGVREIPKEQFYSVMTLGISRIQMYKHLIIPAVLPRTFTALRISTGVSISILFFGENFATTYGIGYFIMNSYAMVNYLEMFSGILALGLMGLIIFRFIDLLENKFCRWISIGKE